VDPDGSRHLLSDTSGVLYLLLLIHDDDTVQGLKLEALGETSAAATLSYLDTGVVFVGSAWGDSQLVRLHPAADASGSFVEVLENFPGLGPIVDFAVVDLERQGQGQIVTCSGVLKDGSLRVVRNGVGINEQAAVELPGLKGIWSLRATLAAEHDTFLVVTFISETRVLAINAEDELDETEVPGFDAGVQTLLCVNAAHDQFLQATPTALRLVDAASRQLVTAWQPASGTSINVAAANAHQVLLGLSGGLLVYLEVDAGALREVARQQIAHEISCLDCQPVGAGASTATLAAVGLWNNSVALLALPTLAPLVEEKLSADAIPRSVLLATFEGTPYLLAGLGDGQLFTFIADPATGALSDRKKLSLGTQPISLRLFRSKATTHVFAASDRPTVMYSSNRKLLFSNVNLREVNHMCSFNSASFPDSLAVASESGLTIGTIDDIQKLHIRTVPLGEQPRRIAHQEATRTFAVCCFKLAAGMDGAAGGGEEGSTSVVRLLDDQTFDTLCSHPLEAFETVCSVISTSFAEDARSYYVVGTAYAHPDEPEPTRGRILVFGVDDGKLSLVVRSPLRAAARARAMNQHVAPPNRSPALAC
jgi:DNA damage-binding protein 1